MKNKVLSIIRSALSEELLYIMRFVRVVEQGNTYVLSFTNPCISHNNWDFVALELARYYGKVVYTVHTDDDGSLVYTYSIKGVSIKGVNIGRRKPDKVISEDSIVPFVASVGSCSEAEYYLRKGYGIEVYVLTEVESAMDRALATLNRCLGGGIK